MLRDHTPRSQLRVVWLIDSLTMGGAEVLTATFAGHADPRLLDVRVVCLRSIGDNVLEDRLRRRGCSVTNLHARNLRDIRAFRKLCALLRQWRTEVIHAHLSYACIWGALAGRCLHVPTVLSMHVTPLTAPTLSRAGVRQRLLVGVARRWAARVIFVSDALRRAWRGSPSAVLGTVIYNGIDCDALDAPGATDLHKVLGLPTDTKIGITVSVLREGKGLDVLIEAAQQIIEHVPNIALVVVGDGGLRAVLEQRIRRLGLQSVVFLLGHRQDVPALLAGSDFFVFPSLYDAFPTAVLEAMAVGLPVIASKTGGIPEMTDGGAALLVTPGDPRALTTAVLELASTAARRRALARAGRLRVRERFSADGWVRRLTEVYFDASARGAAA